MFFEIITQLPCLTIVELRRNKLFSRELQEMIPSSALASLCYAYSLYDIFQ